jgi:hypothetical protein
LSLGRIITQVYELRLLGRRHWGLHRIPEVHSLRRKIHMWLRLRKHLRGPQM